MDEATHPEDDAARPSPGDLSICLSCTSILKFGDDLALMACSPAEIADLPSDIKAELERYRRAVLSIDRSTVNQES
jgi:hypothetical protein